jgi:uncharacterized low-complexity protein
MKKLALALAATAALSLSAASLTPAMANYGACTENPSAKGCPGDYTVKDEPFAQPRHASERHMLRSTKSASYKNEPSKSASSKSSPAKSAAHEPHQPAKQRG